MPRAGGFELQTLDTSIMYAGGNQAAGCAGSWRAGRAAELALEEQSEESFCASDTIAHSGRAFGSLR